MITETLVSDSALQSCITFLYVDVKEPAVPRSGLRLSFASRVVLFSANSKRSFLLRRIPRFLPLHPSAFIFSKVGVAGFEPATLRLSSACSNQLSYTPLILAGKVWWRHGDSNPRPIACKATALPTELCPQGRVNVRMSSSAGRIGNLKQKLNCALPFQIFKASVSFVTEVLGSLA